MKLTPSCLPARSSVFAYLTQSPPDTLASREIGVTEILKKNIAVVLCIVLLSGECVWHVRPVLQRTFGMSDQMTWSDVLDGQLCDPYYSADYVRVELAGGDYLPWPHPDYRTATRKIKSESGKELSIEYSQHAGYFSFEAGQETDEDFILPLTWYEGYTAYKTDKSFNVLVRAKLRKQRIHTIITPDELNRFHKNLTNVLIMNFIKDEKKKKEKKEQVKKMSKTQKRKMKKLKRINKINNNKMATDK